MNSEDLARPVIYITSLLTGKTLYEIYSYGDNVVVMPLEKVEKHKPTSASALAKYAKSAIEHHLQELIQYRCHVEITGPNSLTMYIPDTIKGRVIGKGGARIEEIQKIT